MYCLHLFIFHLIPSKICRVTLDSKVSLVPLGLLE